MLTLDIAIPPRTDLRRVESLVQETCRSRGLTMKVKGSSASYPGSIHWHFKKGAERGTLEVTFWKDGRRLWLSVHDNRTGSWTTKEAVDLKSALEAGLRRKKGS